MGETTTIEYVQSTWNPVSGCTHAGPGCDNCYAERIATRWGRNFSAVMLHRDRAEQPKHWREGRRILTCSMGDLFHSRVPFHYVHSVFNTMQDTPRHTYLLLTKRPGRMAHFAKLWAVLSHWPENIWAGTSISDARHLRWLDVLARVPAKVRWVSLEPLLGPVDLTPWLSSFQWITEHMEETGHIANWRNSRGAGCYECDTAFKALSWVVVGGETGPRARPMDIAWVDGIADQCTWADVPLFVKQDSGPRPGQQGRLADGLWAFKEMP